MKKNIENLESENKLSPILKKVADILEMDNKQILDLEKDELNKGLQKTIEEILTKNKDNKKLVKMLLKEYRGNIFFIIDNEFKNNKEIALLAVKNSVDNFYSLDNKLKKDLDVLRELVKSFIRESVSFLEFERFVEDFSKDDLKTKNTLYSFYQKYLNVYSNVYLKDDLSQVLLAIKKNNTELYNALKSNNVIISKGKQTNINPSFVESIFMQIKNENIVFENLDEKKKVVFLVIGNILGVDINSLDSDSYSIFENIFNIYLGIENKYLLNKKEQENKKQKEENIKSEDKKTEETSENEDKQEDDFEDVLDFCLPSCNYSYVSGVYEISLGENRKIKLTKEEQEGFNTQALKNFIEFYNTFYDLGLNFLWDKYKTSFSTLLKNKLDFDYKIGAGFTKGKMLGALNLIGKNIGVPEKEIISSESEGKKKTTRRVCFKTLEAAKLAFGEIKETGKINGELYSDLGAFSKTAVENKLIMNGKIDVDRGELNISKW